MTDYGKSIKKQLIDLDKPQKWLIKKVHEETGLYFDSSYLNKILNGKIMTPGIIAAIDKILSIKEKTK